MSAAENQPAHLEPSELGTKEYWDRLYTNELSNHAADPSDIGTVWFDDSDAEAKMVEFLDDLEQQQQQGSATTTSTLLPLSSLRRDTASLLDLGCGNGSLLFALRDDGWSARALGVDYSPQSVALARQVAASRVAGDDQRRDDDDDEEEEEKEERDDTAGTAAPAVEFSEWDIIGGDPATALNGAQAAGWDVVLDKGTFDAISLSDARDVASGRRLCECYRDRVLALVRPAGGLFLVTSCNWTEEELRSWFVPAEGEGEGGSGDTAPAARFQVAGRVSYPTFSFGGVKGQTISTLCFRRI